MKPKEGDNVAVWCQMTEEEKYGTVVELLSTQFVWEDSKGNSRFAFYRQDNQGRYLA